MKGLIFVSLLLFACNTTAENNSGKSLDDLNWLLGHWNTIEEDSNVLGFERWERTDYGNFKGIGISMEFGDTVFVEYLSITSKDSLLFYIADLPENSKPVLFQITEIRPDGFICVNDSNEFPKKIEYKLNKDSLDVTISGPEKSFIFEFVKAG
jgi:hypothetical protein